jgi:hypothetical protein
LSIVNGASDVQGGGGAAATEALGATLADPAGAVAAEPLPAGLVLSPPELDLSGHPVRAPRAAQAQAVRAIWRVQVFMGLSEGRRG